MVCYSWVDKNQITIIGSSSADSDSKPQYLCKDGAGESEGKALKKLSICDKTQCEEECSKDFKCMGFDFATQCKSDSCRLFPTNIPRLKDIKTRKYCEKTDSK